MCTLGAPDVEQLLANYKHEFRKSQQVVAALAADTEHASSIPNATRKEVEQRKTDQDRVTQVAAEKLARALAIGRDTTEKYNRLVQQHHVKLHNMKRAITKLEKTAAVCKKTRAALKQKTEEMVLLKSSRDMLMREYKNLVKSIGGLRPPPFEIQRIIRNAVQQADTTGSSDMKKYFRKLEKIYSDLTVKYYNDFTLSGPSVFQNAEHSDASSSSPPPPEESTAQPHMPSVAERLLSVVSNVVNNDASSSPPPRAPGSTGAPPRSPPATVQPLAERVDANETLLPEWWEKMTTVDGTPFYVDHNDRSTTWDAPPTGGTRGPGVLPLSPPQPRRQIPSASADASSTPLPRVNRKARTSKNQPGRGRMSTIDERDTRLKNDTTDPQATGDVNGPSDNSTEAHRAQRTATAPHATPNGLKLYETPIDVTSPLPDLTPRVTREVHVSSHNGMSDTTQHQFARPTQPRDDLITSLTDTTIGLVNQLRKKATSYVPGANAGRGSSRKNHRRSNTAHAM